MKTAMHFLNRQITGENADARLARWSCFLGSIGIFIVATVAFVKHAASVSELLCGLSVALLTCAVLFSTGILTSRLQWALIRAPIPRRLRIPEFAGYVLMLVILLGGVWNLPALPFHRAGMTMALLLVLAASTGTGCLGMWCTFKLARRGLTIPAGR